MPSQEARESGSPTPDQIRGQLRRILASPHFNRAPRLERFLAYVVEEALAGRDENIQEYMIGLEVFDRRGIGA